MQFDNIPAELKQLRQWLVWRSRDLGHRKNVKVPYQTRNVWDVASVNRPETWSTFAEAEQAVTANPGLGLGFVFTTNDPYVGIDIDDEAKIDPRNLDNFRKLRDVLLSGDSYAELSPSRNGAHIIVKGKLPRRGYRPNGINVELYASGRFFTMTGDIIRDRRHIAEDQGLIDGFMARFPAPDHEDLDPMFIGPSEVNGRRLDLTDDQVLAMAWNMPGFPDRYQGIGIRDWSVEHYRLVGDIDKLTGDPDQLVRIVHNSPFVLNAEPKAGVKRITKSRRIIMDDLAAVRGSQDGFRHSPMMIEQGRKIWESLQAHRAEAAEKRAKEILREAEGAFSSTGVQLLKAFPLPPNFLTLTPPPGVTGRLAVAASEAMYNPFLKFSLPATLATLAGILGRQYKLPGGKGLNLNFILAAATSTGKTSAMDALEKFLYRASKDIGYSITTKPTSRIIKASASSIQGIFPAFMESPAAVWFISECASQLAQMSAPKSNVDSQMRDAYNDLFDCSAMGKMFSPPRSVANRKADIEPIENLSVSTFWTTTTSKFDVFNEDAQDGFLSRVVVIRHAGQAGEAIPDWEVRSSLDDELHQALVNRLSAAKNFDEALELGHAEAYKRLIFVSTELIDAQVWAFRQISERIKNAALAGTMPAPYTAVSRLPMSAMRLAAVLAVMDQPYEPVISLEHFEWSFGYLLQNMAALLSDLDTGELGATMSNDTDVVVREIKKMMLAKNQVGVKKGEITLHLKKRKPFKDQINPGDAVKRTLAEMIAHEVLRESIMFSGPNNKQANLLMPTDDEAWK